MRDKIGETAGEIWRILRNQGEVNVAQLPKLLEEKSTIVYQGLGWLARENKIEYQTKAAKTYVFLTETERGK